MRRLTPCDRHRPNRSVITFFFLVDRDPYERHTRAIRRNLRIANPDEIEQIFFSDGALLSEKWSYAESDEKDEARMTNDQGMTKPEAQCARWRSFRHLIIGFVSSLEHLSFVISLTRERSHMLDHVVAKLRTLDFSRAFHQTRKIVSDAFACDRAA